MSLSGGDMSNVPHPKCAIRNLANEAKQRLIKGEYYPPVLEPSKNFTPSEKDMFLKLRDLYEKGEEVVNPVEQLADKDYMDSLPHDERQRYIMTLCSNYVDMKNELARRLASCPTAFEDRKKKAF